MQYPILCRRLFWDLIQRILSQQIRDQLGVAQTWTTNLPVILFNPSLLEHTGGTGGSELASHGLIKLSNADDQTSFRFLFLLLWQRCQKKSLEVSPLESSNVGHQHFPRNSKGTLVKEIQMAAGEFGTPETSNKNIFKTLESSFFWKKTTHPSTLVKDGWKLQANVFFVFLCGVIFVMVNGGIQKKQQHFKN